MKNKTIITLLLAVASMKGFSQIITPQDNAVQTQKNNNKFAIIEIGKYKPIWAETTTLFYSSGEIEDLSALLYNPENNKLQYLPNLPVANYSKNETISEPLKALVCIQYMAEKNYVLVSSNSTRWEGIYAYQYVFEKKEN